MCENFKTILTIAGCDPMAGAGIQADIKTTQALKVYAMSVVTAVTAQNYSGVKGIMPVDKNLLHLQLQCVMEERKPDAVKIGMIPNAETANVIADFLLEKDFPFVVVDPVMISSSGDLLSSNETLNILQNKILPQTYLLTPNIPEAEKLSEMEILSAEDAKKAGERIIKRYGCKSVLVKGGHLQNQDELQDTLIYKKGANIVSRIFTHDFIETNNTHGTGCTLSSAIASFLALGYKLEEGVDISINYLHRVLKESCRHNWGAGKNHPMWHNIEKV